MNVRVRSRKFDAVTLSALFVVLSAAVSVPARADDATSGRWVLAADGTPVVPGQVVNVGGHFTMAMTFIGAYARFTCSLPSGSLEVTVPDPVPSAPSAGTVTINVTPPAVLSSSDSSDTEYDRCSNDLWGVSDDAVTSGVDWVVSLGTPADPSSTPETLTASLHLPEDALGLSNDLFYPGCVITVPSESPAALTGIYDAGSFAADAGQGLGPEATGPCTVEDPAEVNAFSLTLDPALDLVYLP